MIQITLIRLEGYGPWTTTLGDDREHRLQILQARLYSDMQEQFSKRNGLVFFNRFDEMFAVSNGISKDEHERILEIISTSYSNLKISMSIGVGSTPYKAHEYAKIATTASSNMVNVYHDYSNDDNDSLVQIMHVDIDGSTSNVSSVMLPYDISILVTRLNLALSEAFLAYGALTFFLGGDNFMIVSGRLSKNLVKTLLNKVMSTLNIRLKCGIGVASNARGAAMLATRALDMIREMRKSNVKYDNVLELIA
jgi:GTP cyclohydrolase IIa